MFDFVPLRMVGSDAPTYQYALAGLRANGLLPLILRQAQDRLSVTRLDLKR